MKERPLITLEELNRRSVASRRAKASVRREKVKALREQGKTGPQIAQELDIKLRLVHADFSILKKELQEEIKLAFSRKNHRLGCELEEKFQRWTRGKLPK